MKRFQLLLIAAAFISTTVAVARDHNGNYEVMLITDGESNDPEIYEFDTPEKMKEHLRDRREEREMCKETISAQLTEVIPTGFKAPQAPSLIFAQKENKFAFSVGGYVELRTSYDFNGTVDNIDFVTADIPIPNNYATHQQIMMDASTSRLYLAGVVNSRALGRVDIFVDMDFRGDVGYSSSGISNSYMPRLRSAYASFLGITVGRDVTTFSDSAAAPQTVDFQGPNAYCFNFSTLVRYERSLCDDHLTAALALEYPTISATYDTTYEAIPQRVPDIPMFVQYEFGEERQSHIRASAVLRNMYAYDVTDDDNTSLFGWGVQASGRINPVDWMGVCFNGIYGEGITYYIQDLNGLGLDFTPNPEDSSAIQTMPMFGWQVAADFRIIDRLTINGGYSTAQVQWKNGYYSDDEYRRGQYVFGNVFYSVTPRFQVACEYLYGRRRNMDCTSNFSNRVSIMAKMNF